MSQIVHAQWRRTAPNVYLRTATDKVGIGTTTPTQKLDVRGDAIFNGVRVGRGTGGVSSNTVLGRRALNSNTTGSGNTATGFNTLFLNTTGYDNTATGYQALDSNTTGNWNTATGYQALISNRTGVRNNANGHQALYSNTTGDNNTATGDFALFYNTTGHENTGDGGGDAVFKHHRIFEYRNWSSFT